ncbi:hypothetical protein [Pelagibius sp. 7325]|uniref:hypothetical protein n=1 Tax=Pelagibius sp. 7325 TaxID=3131994 RepID=UPI0030ED8F90
MSAHAPTGSAGRKRPFGVTLLSLLMGWLTLAAALNSVVFPSQIEGWPVVITVLTVAYAVTAGATTIGLWRMRSWSLTTFSSWGVVLLLLMAAFLFFIDFWTIIGMQPLVAGPHFVIFTVTMVLVYWLLHRYIRRHVVGLR